MFSVVEMPGFPLHIPLQGCYRAREAVFGPGYARSSLPSPTINPVIVRLESKVWNCC